MMSPDVARRTAQYSGEIQALFDALRTLVLESVPFPVEEELWADMPSYSHEGRCVRLVPFKDHINIVAGYLRECVQDASYRFTPTGMLQLFPGQNVPADALRFAFHRSLTEG